MTDTCETCRWAKLDADELPGWYVCDPSLPPMLHRITRQNAGAQKWVAPADYYCALHTAKEDVSRG